MLRIWPALWSFLRNSEVPPTNNAAEQALRSIVLERDDRAIAGIEVKASATVKAGDFAGLRALAAACDDRFAFGVVLHDSADVVPFGDRLAAAPLSSLWN